MRHERRLYTLCPEILVILKVEKYKIIMIFHETYKITLIKRYQDTFNRAIHKMDTELNEICPSDMEIELFSFQYRLTMD